MELGRPRREALSSYFYEPIEGFADVQGELDAEGAYVEGRPLLRPASRFPRWSTTRRSRSRRPRRRPSFPQRLGYTAFSPLPEVFFEDVDAFGLALIGSARSRWSSTTRTWTSN